MSTPPSPFPTRIPLSSFSQSASATPDFALLKMTFMGHKGEGCVEENQDRLLLRKLAGHDAELILMGVADGVSRCPRGGAVASYLMEK
ncbi:MAG TPA: hypothetical protein VF614_07585, partial [Chthoniobacteraceae bacterium]